MSDLMRDEFEKSRIGDGIDPEELWLDSVSGEYIADEQIYWQIWQNSWKASRGVMVIKPPDSGHSDFPNHRDSFDHGYIACDSEWQVILKDLGLIVEEG